MVADRSGAPRDVIELCGDRSLEVRGVGNGQAAAVDEVAQLSDAFDVAIPIAGAEQAGQVCPVDDEGAVAAAPAG